MLLTANMPDARDFEVRDASGRLLGGVMSYDTETQETEMYLCDSEYFVVFPFSETEYQPVMIKTIIPGSYAVDRRTGETLKSK